MEYDRGEILHRQYVRDRDGQFANVPGSGSPKKTTSQLPKKSQFKKISETTANKKIGNSKLSKNKRKILINVGVGLAGSFVTGKAMTAVGVSAFSPTGFAVGVGSGIATGVVASKLKKKIK